MFVSELQKLRGNKQVNILVCGLNKSGKSSIIDRFNIGEIESTTVAIGVVKSVEMRNIMFTILEPKCVIDKFRPLLKYFSQNAKGLFLIC